MLDFLLEFQGARLSGIPASVVNVVQIFMLVVA